MPYLMFMAVRELWAATELAPPPHPADDGSAGQTTGTGMTGSLSLGRFPLAGGRSAARSTSGAAPSTAGDGDETFPVKRTLTVAIGVGGGQRLAHARPPG